MRKQAISYLVAAAATLAAGASAAPASNATCATAGATAAVAAKALGSGAKAASSVVGGRRECVLARSAASGATSITIVLYPGAILNKAVESEMYQGQVTSHGLTGLGAGAVFLATSDHSFQHLWFETPRYTVKLTSDGSRPAAPAKLLGVARAVYGHLS
jgi:hypothetical protein